MLRYVAFVWNRENSQQSKTAATLAHRLQLQEPWDCVANGNGYSVFCTGRGAVGAGRFRLANQAGAIVGSVFRRNTELMDNSPCREPDFDTLETDLIRRTKGRRLTEVYWGWYVAFLPDADSRTVRVLRSPMSELPCLYTCFRGVVIIFSRIEDCAQIGCVPLTIDWTYITHQIAHGFLIARSGECAIREVSALQGGECMEIGVDGYSIHTYWTPHDFAKNPISGDQNYAANALRATTRACVGAWSTNHESVALRLSGGLDSSIVLCCLRGLDRMVSVAGVNYYADGPGADERRFAHAMAQHAGVTLHERELSHHTPMNVFRRINRTPIPIVNNIDWHEYPWEQNWARSIGATAIFSGTLGDSIFEKNTHLSPVADFLTLKGMRSGVLLAALDVAMYQKVSFWRVLWGGLHEAWINPPRGAWNPYSALREEGLALKERYSMAPDEDFNRKGEDAKRFVHPWLHHVDGTPSGKLWMIAALCSESFYESHFTGLNDVPIIPAFFSQPLVELCLQIPTYFNVGKGQDRAIARSAFSGDLAPEILRRPTKGGPDAWLRDALERNGSFVREFLMEGELIKRGLVDKRKLTEALPGVPTKRSAAPGIIMNLLCTEGWIQSWLDVKLQHIDSAA